ncbi:hypothetical protein [Azospirillum oryzae]|uniref:hypothetical protein n=1 Tax=Azospirillum oryzae TaxID=286727 RepID=UPI000A146E10|nr:hypothetical protein [Azospirillum oryzae]
MSDLANSLTLSDIQTSQMWCLASEGEVQESIGTFSLAMKVGVSACTARRSVIADVDMSRAGLRRSTTNQADRGAVVPLVAARHAAMCSCAAVLRWLAVAGDDPGPLYMQATRNEDLRAGLHRLSDRTVARIVQSALGVTPPAIPATACATAWPPLTPRNSTLWRLP